uniref:Crinkler effector protein N-terminal domain-containing protein n=1 Tax=Rhizophagus irregularis (strain DAOM 181602 / DAOM 197198 / MUCL 43194) TaxID=747089 RepID=U9SFS1_RHIID
MSITLLCLVKGNTLANAFSVKISRDEPVSELKKKVEIGSDHLDNPLKNLTLNDNNELSAINEIGDYWTEKPPKKHIYVLVEPPASTATSTREQELLERISLLEKSLSKSVHGMYFCQEISGTVQSRKSLGHESLKSTGYGEHLLTLLLHYSIRRCCKSETDEELQVDRKYRTRDPRWSQRTHTWSAGKFSPRNDQGLREMLNSFPKVCQLYGLGESDDLLLLVFSPFTCKYKEMEENSSKAIFNNLVTELKARLKAIPISGNEASKSQYVCSYLVTRVNLYEGKFELRPEKNITGPMDMDQLIL